MLMISEIIELTRETFRCVLKINSRFKACLFVREAKQDGLYKYWNNLVTKMIMKALIVKDVNMQKQLVQIQSIDKDIKNYVIDHYINQTNFLHRQAFMEWRIYVSKERKNIDDDIKENAFWLSDKELEEDIIEKYDNGRQK